MLLGVRYRKSIQIVPGVKLNISKSGISTSIGKPGATVNLSSRGTRVTTGLPGTGLSYSTYIRRASTRRNKNEHRYLSKSERTNVKNDRKLKTYQRRMIKRNLHLNEGQMRWLESKARRDPSVFVGRTDEEIAAYGKHGYRKRKVVGYIICTCMIIGFILFCVARK